MDLAYSERKFAELVLHVADRLRKDRAGGATKLNKVVFLAEFTHLRRHQAVVSHPPGRLSVFSADELTSIDGVLDQLAGMTATQVSDLSHQEPGWRLTELGETIPFATAFPDFPQVATPSSERLSRELAERYGHVKAG